MGKDDPVEKLAERFLCPITQDIMRDPVVAADGFTYERAAIEEWIRKKGRRTESPMTNQRLIHHELIPNILVYSMIQEYLTTLQSEIRQRELQKELTEHDINLAIQLRENELQARLAKQGRHIAAVSAERDRTLEKIGPMERENFQLRKEIQTISEKLTEQITKVENENRMLHERIDIQEHMPPQQSLTDSSSAKTNSQEFQSAQTHEQQRLQAKLVRACELGISKDVKKLIKEGALPNLLSSLGQHPFGAAIMGGNPKIIYFLDSLHPITAEELQKILNINEKKYGIRVASKIPHFKTVKDRIDWLSQRSHITSHGSHFGSFLHKLWMKKQGHKFILDLLLAYIPPWLTIKVSTHPLSETNQQTLITAKHIWVTPNYLANKQDDKLLDEGSILHAALWNKCKQEVDEFIEQKLQQQFYETTVVRPT